MSSSAPSVDASNISPPTCEGGLLVICECPGSLRYGPIFEKLFGGALPDTLVVPCSSDHLEEMQEKLNDTNLFARIKTLLITGSASSAYDTEPWIVELKKVIRKVCFSSDLKHVVGICFGHQVIASAFGMVVEKNCNGHEGGVSRWTMTQEARSFLQDLAPGSIDEGNNGTMHLFCWHGDSVTWNKDPRFELGGGNVNSACQMLLSQSETNYKILTFQSHPEFSADIVASIADLCLGRGSVDCEQHKKILEDIRCKSEDVRRCAKWIQDAIYEFCRRSGEGSSHSILNANASVWVPEPAMETHVTHQRMHSATTRRKKGRKKRKHRRGKKNTSNFNSANDIQKNERKANKQRRSARSKQDKKLKKGRRRYFAKECENTGQTEHQLEALSNAYDVDVPVNNFSVFPSLSGHKDETVTSDENFATGRPKFTRDFVSAYFKSHCRNFLRAVSTGKWQENEIRTEVSKISVETNNNMNERKDKKEAESRAKEGGQNQGFILLNKQGYARHRMGPKESAFLSDQTEVPEVKFDCFPKNACQSGKKDHGMLTKGEKKEMQALFSDAKFYENTPEWYDPSVQKTSSLLSKSTETSNTNETLKTCSSTESETKWPAQNIQKPLAKVVQLADESGDEMSKLHSCSSEASAAILMDFQDAVRQDDSNAVKACLKKVVNYSPSPVKIFRDCRDFLMKAVHEWEGSHVSSCKYFTTPLMAAVLFKSFQVAELLLDDGQVDPLRRVVLRYNNGKVKQRLSSLHLAAHLGHPEMLSLLLEHVTSRDRPDCLGSFNWRDRSGNTPLHLAAAGGSNAHTQCIKILLDSSLPKRILLKLNCWNKQGKMPAHIASELNHEESLSILLNLQSPPLSSCAQYAAENGSINALKLLVSKGGSCGGEELVLAATNGHLECCQIIVDALILERSELALKSGIGNALSAAAVANRPQVIQLLMDAAIDRGGSSLCSSLLSEVNVTGDTPILTCARDPSLRLECLEKLILTPFGQHIRAQMQSCNGHPQISDRKSNSLTKLHLRGNSHDLLKDSNQSDNAMPLPLSLLDGSNSFEFANLLLSVGGRSLLDHPNRKFETPLFYLLRHLSASKSADERLKILEGLAFLIDAGARTTELLFAKLERELFGKTVTLCPKRPNSTYQVGTPATRGDPHLRWLQCDASLEMHSFYSCLPLTDVVSIICSDGKQLQAHKAVLVSEVDIFGSMLTSPMKEGIAGIIRLPEFSSCAIEIILDFIYGFKVPLLSTDNLKDDDVRTLLEALTLAHYLMFQKGFAPIAMQIERHMSPGTILEILQTAAALRPETQKLDIVARSYTLRNFQKISDSWLLQGRKGPKCRDIAVYILTSAH